MRSMRILLFALLCSGCGLIGPDDALDTERDRLERNAQLWSSTAPPHYAFIMQRLCFCGTESTNRVRVEVLNGAVISRTYLDTGQPVGANWRDLFPTMEGVFQILREALDRNAAEFTAQYDPERGYPLSAVIDYVANAVDDELTVRVTAFSVE